MKKNTQPQNRSYQKKDKGAVNSAGRLRFLYILVLFLMIFSLFARLGGGRPRASTQTAGGTAARVLVFHQEDAGGCEDLTVTATGTAILSNCGKGAEKEYTLDSAERSQLQAWLATYSPVNYERQNQASAGNPATQLYLNGQGTRSATDEQVQQLIGFATRLEAKIAAGS